MLKGLRRSGKEFSETLMLQNCPGLLTDAIAGAFTLIKKVVEFIF
jgi:hypothetical protein